MSSSELQIRISAVNQASATLAQVQSQVERLQTAGSKMQAVGSKISGFGMQLGAATTLPIVAGLGFAVREAIKFEEAQADVDKVLGKSEVAAVGLREKVLAMSRTLPVSAEGLMQIAAAGGTLGIKAKDMAGFVEVTAKMGVAFGMTADKAGEAIAKLRNVYSLDAKGGTAQTVALGDTVNTLSNNMAAKAPDIVEAMTRIGGTTRTFGMSSDHAAALAASIISLGNAPEIAATAINGILPALQTAEGGTKRFKEGLQMAGFSAKDMSQMVQKDGVGALTTLLGSLQKLEPAQRALAINKMFGNGADSRILGTLANDASALTNALNLVNNASTKAKNSMEKEFQTRAATTANALQLLKNNLTEVAVNIGSALLPAVNSVVRSIQPMIQGFSRFANANPGIIRVAAAFALVVAAIAPIVMFVGSLVGAVGTLSSAFAAVGPVIAGIGAVGFAPIVAGAVALAAAAFLVYKNWASIKAFFAGFAKGFIQGIQPLIPILEWIGSQIQQTFSILGQTEQAAGGIRSLGQAFGEMAAFAVRALVELPFNLAQIGIALGDICNSWMTTFRMFFVNLGLEARIAFLTVGQTISQWAANVGIAFANIGNTIGTFFTSLWLRISTFFMTIGTILSTAFMTLVTTIGPAFAQIGAVISAWIMMAQVSFSAFGIWIQMVFMQVQMAVANFGMMFGMVFAGIIAQIMTFGMSIQATFMAMVASVGAMFASLGATISAAFASAVAAVTGAMASMVASISSGASQAVSAVVSMGSGIVGAVTGIAGSMFSAGANIIQQLINGIMSKVGEAQAAIANVAGQIRGALPFSPAKWGPLSDLDKIQLVETIASTITPAPIVGALSSALGVARDAMSMGALPVGGMGTTPIAPGNQGGSGSPINLTYAPVINSVEGGNRDIMGILRAHSRELLEILESAENRRNRTSYTPA